MDRSIFQKWSVLYKFWAIYMDHMFIKIFTPTFEKWTEQQGVFHQMVHFTQNVGNMDHSVLYGPVHFSKN